MLASNLMFTLIMVQRVIFVKPFFPQKTNPRIAAGICSFPENRCGLT